MSKPRWTASEDELLRASYTTGGIAAACAALPTRTRTAILLRANRTGLSSPRNWTSRDDDRLRWLWGGGGSLARVASAVGRSQWACYERAKALGLRLGVPQGFEHFTASASRVGVSPSKLRKILTEYRVPMTRALSRPARVKWHHRAVDPHDVDQAIAAWVRE